MILGGFNGKSSLILFLIAICSICSPLFRLLFSLRHCSELRVGEKQMKYFYHKDFSV